jgi:hypothetical protein
MVKLLQAVRATPLGRRHAPARPRRPLHTLAGPRRPPARGLAIGYQWRKLVPTLFETHLSSWSWRSAQVVNFESAAGVWQAAARAASAGSATATSLHLALLLLLLAASKGDSQPAASRCGISDSGARR